MALVDYSSTSGSSDGESVGSAAGAPPPAKRRRPDGDSSRVDGARPGDKGKQPAPSSELPPLPDSFHDMYASSVRNSVSDDPSMHNGRKRAVPHVAGNWPSHVYIECISHPSHFCSHSTKSAQHADNYFLQSSGHPTTQEHAMLVDLVAQAQRALGDRYKLNSFLTSDLNAPLPLHISLSKPLSLTTATKDAFLDKLSSSLRAFQPPRASPPSSTSTSSAPTASATQDCSFTVSPVSIAFYKSPDSDRTFFVLRVANAVTSKPYPGTSSNPQLRDLLKRSNAAAESFGLQSLYAPAGHGRQPAASATADGAVEEEPGSETDVFIDSAFHVSIGWTFKLPDEETCIRTYRIFRKDPFREVKKWKIRVGGVKVKIGNVVTHVPLAAGRYSSSSSIGTGSSPALRGASGSPAGSITPAGAGGYRSSRTPGGGRAGWSPDGDDSPWR